MKAIEFIRENYPESFCNDGERNVMIFEENEFYEMLSKFKGIVCKEQREICSNELDILENYDKALGQILNAPEPEI